MIKVLVACEESQRVCIAFRSLGIEAYSCDIQECSGGYPEWHILGDAVEQAYSGKYDLMIAHPPCTYFSIAGSGTMFKGKTVNQNRYKKLLESRKFFMELYEAPIKYICIENPIPIKIAELPQFTQCIQPYQFGHHYSKKTLLWLKNLPLLRPTKIVREYSPYIQTKSWRYRNKPDSMIKKKGGEVFFPIAEKQKDRSKTFEGIAEAMANQWSVHVLEQKQKEQNNEH